MHCELHERSMKSLEKKNGRLANLTKTEMFPCEI